MFDNKKYRETQSELKMIRNNLIELEKIKDNILKDLNQLENNCNHDLTLIYDVNYYLNNSSIIMRKGNCLCCNKEFVIYYELSLDDNKSEMVYKKIKNGKLEIINKENIIDATNVVSRNNWGSKLFLDAKELLNNLDTDEISIEEVKKLINNSLVEKYQTNKSLRKLYKED